MKKKLIMLLTLPLLLTNCNNWESTGYDKAYIHLSSTMAAVADLHGNNECFFYGERGILDQKVWSVDNYSTYFNLKESTINFKCLVDDNNIPYGKMSFKLVLNNGTVYIDEQNVNYVGYGTYYEISIDSDIDSKYSLKFYEVNPYWVRMNMPFNIDGVIKTLTFEWTKPLKGDENIPDIFK